MARPARWSCNSTPPSRALPISIPRTRLLIRPPADARRVRSFRRLPSAPRSETSFTAAAAAVINPAMALAEPLPETAGALAEPETGGTLIIDLAAIAANWRALAHQALTVECAAVVKANAYGLGLEQVTAALAKAGCKTFFVADLAEVRSVRSRARDAT